MNYLEKMITKGERYIGHYQVDDNVIVIMEK